MNIFVLSEDPVEAAQMLCDKHAAGKMVVESAQMLSTVHRMLDGNSKTKLSKSGKRTVKYWSMEDRELEDLLYKPVHFSHPCTTWTMETRQNYQWHYEHFVALGNEFEFRFNKQHKSILKLKEFLSNIPKNIPNGKLTKFALAMKKYPQCVVENDAVQSYRNFYHADKSFAEWNHSRQAPSWWMGYKGPDYFKRK